MDVFGKFKEALKKSVGRLKGKDDPSLDLLKAIESSDNWEALEQHLVELRVRSRKRQQEVVDRLEPLAKRVEEKLAEAKKAKIKTIRENLLRQAQGYLHELEAEDEPAKIHSANCDLLTSIIKQVQRVSAMGDRVIEAENIDAISVRLEEIVETHDSAVDAAKELELAGQGSAAEGVDAGKIEQRLSSLYADDAEADASGEAAGSSSPEAEELERKLYE